jgi:hypothetical protein
MGLIALSIRVECYYVEGQNAQNYGFLIDMLNVIMLSVVMLSVVAPFITLHQMIQSWPYSS